MPRGFFKGLVFCALAGATWAAWATGCDSAKSPVIKAQPKQGSEVAPADAKEAQYKMIGVK